MECSLNAKYWTKHSHLFVYVTPPPQSASLPPELALLLLLSSALEALEITHHGAHGTCLLALGTHSLHSPHLDSTSFTGWLTLVYKFLIVKYHEMTLLC